MVTSQNSQNKYLVIPSTTSCIMIEQNCVLWISVISSFLRKVGEVCALLGYYAVCSVLSLQTFGDNISFPTLRVKNSKKISWSWNMGPICCPETSVRNYNYTQSNNLEDRRSVWIY